MARKWGEVGVKEITFQPVITSTNTVEKWREWAQDNLLVKVDSTSTKAAGDGEVAVERCTASTDVPIGVLRAITGDSSFPNKPRVRVAIFAYDCNVDGAGSGALADADYGRRIKPDANGKASIVTSGGFGRVIGGTKANLRLAFDFIDNYR